MSLNDPIRVQLRVQSWNSNPGRGIVIDRRVDRNVDGFLAEA